MKKLIIDSSSLISLSDSCLLGILYNLKKIKQIEFIIPESVAFESVEKPLKIKRFELNAVRINNAIENGSIKVHHPDKQCSQDSLELERLANSVFHNNGQDIKILHKGELDSIVLLKELNSQVLVIDERITRMLLEEPEGLRKMLQRRQHRSIKLRQENLDELNNFLPKHSIVRSSEIIALAHDEQVLLGNTTTTQELEAALYAVKFKGCAISNLEIKKYLRGFQNGI